MKSLGLLPSQIFDNVRQIFDRFSIDFRQMFDSFSIDVRQIFYRCSVDFRQMFDRCSIDVRQIFDRFSIDFRQMFHRFSIDFRQMFDRCSIDFSIDFRQMFDRFSIDFRQIFRSLWVTLGSFLVYGWTLKPYLSQFDVEKLEMASVMGICGSLVGPKSENVEKVQIFKGFLKGQGSHEDARESLRSSEPDRWEGVGGG